MADNVHLSTKRQFRIISAIAVLVILIGMVFYHFAENLNWLDSLHFCVVTLTTIGYGDIAPKTAIGKLFTVIYVLGGISIVAAFINIALRRAVAKRVNKN